MTPQEKAREAIYRAAVTQLRADPACRDTVRQLRANPAPLALTRDDRDFLRLIQIQAD